MTATKTINGVKFTAGEAVIVKGVEFVLKAFSRRGIILRRPPSKPAVDKTRWINGD